MIYGNTVISIISFKYGLNGVDKDVSNMCSWRGDFVANLKTKLNIQAQG